MNRKQKLLGGWVLALGLLQVSAHAVAQSTVTYVYTDTQGTPLAEADANGNVTATFDYAPYGSQALGTAPNGPGYTGHVNDPDTGLVYMQARYYDPSVGRFISTDPVTPTVGNAFNFNRYGYANNNPIDHIDPDGRCTGSNISGTNGVCLGGSGSFVAGAGYSEFFYDSRETSRPPLNSLAGDVKYTIADSGPNSPEVHPVFSGETTDHLNSAFRMLNKDGIVPKINSAFRTPSEQEYMQKGGSGSNPAAKVSWHEAGAAVDINGTKSPQFQTIISVMKENGFTWGGGFNSKKDPPHFDGRGFSGNQSEAVNEAQIYWDSTQ